MRLVNTGIPQNLRGGNASGWDHWLPRLQLAASGQAVGPDPYPKIDRRNPTLLLPGARFAS
jgi:hypothetical protein